jgi:hypothetical protein
MINRLRITGIFVASLLSGVSLAAADTDLSELLAFEMPRQGFMADAKEFAEVIPPRAVASEGLRTYSDALLDLYETYPGRPEVHYFFCTVYYTPQESGFVARRGFNVSTDGRRQLGSRKFPKDFLRSVVMEGYGRLATPQGTRDYVKYDGSWGYGTRSLGNRNNTLIDRDSAAVHRSHPLMGKGTRLLVLDPEIYNTFGGMRFEAADTGGGLFRSQIDLFWGEDDPLGPGADIYRPATCDVAVRWVVPVIIWR